MATASPRTAVEYEVTIGLEVHAQLLTDSKMFCRCSTDYANAAPNKLILYRLIYLRLAPASDSWLATSSIASRRLATKRDTFVNT